MTGTVEVRVHDLHRLLLMFRAGVEEDRIDEWAHHADYDISFERLADAVEQAEGRTDPRMRCKHDHGAYRWPGPVAAQWMNVVHESGADRKVRHLAASTGPVGLFRSVCGFTFAVEDITKHPARPYGKCAVCVRELGLRRNVTVEDGQL